MARASKKGDMVNARSRLLVRCMHGESVTPARRRICDSTSKTSSSAVASVYDPT